MGGDDVRFISKSKEKQQSISDHVEIKKQIEQPDSETIVKARQDIKTQQRLASNYISEHINDPITQQIQDANLQSQIKQLRKQMNDEDTDNSIKVKDVIQQTEIYRSAKPPAEQILAGFSPTPVYTQGGQQYPSNDGTQAFVETKDGVLLVTDIDLEVQDMNPEISTQDVINQYIEYDGPFDDFYDQMNDYVNATVATINDQQIINQTRQSVQDGYKQIQIQEQSAGQQLANIPQVETPKFDCQINVDWKTILFWMLVLNFNQPVDITQGLLKYIVKPIEEVLNFVLGSIRDIGFTINIWPVYFEWYPFKWIPVFTWWEDLLQYVQTEEYKSMCSFMKFDQSKTLGTTIGGQYFIDNKLNQISGSGKLSATQARMLQVLALGYDQFGSSIYSKDQIRKQLGNVI